MTEGLPLSHSYNLARLGNAGDEVLFSANETERAAIAKWAGIVSVEKLAVRVQIKKLETNRFSLVFFWDADLTQSCVVSLEPVPAHIDHSFSRELVFAPRHRPDQAGGVKEPESEAVLDFKLDGEEGPEEITSLHLDLAVPVLEEFVLSLDPYPRRPGVEFSPKKGESDPPASPFAVLKTLK